MYVIVRRCRTCRIAVASSLVPSPTKLLAAAAGSPLNLLEGSARVELSSSTANIPATKHNLTCLIFHFSINSKSGGLF
jgi:hypothetical protein